MKYLRLLVPLWPWAIALLAVLGYGCEERRAGALGARVAVLTGELDQLTKQAAVARVQYVHDTVTLEKAVTRWRTRVDSALRVDTVPLTVRESVFVAAADTAISACRSVVSSCATAQRADSLVIRNQAATIRALEQARPGVVRRWGERLLWAGAGFAAGSIVR